MNALSAQRTSELFTEIRRLGIPVNNAGIIRLMAGKLGPMGIQSNAIAPGYMATDNTQALRADAERCRAIQDRIPAGR